MENLVETRDNNFIGDLTRTLVSANIPISKLNHPEMIALFKKYAGINLPDESTVRKFYVSKLYEATLLRIRAEIGNSPIYIQVDESTDAKNRPVLCILAGALNGKEPKSFLIDVIYLEASPDAQIILQSVADSLRIIWPDKIHYERVRLLLSDQDQITLHDKGRSAHEGKFISFIEACDLPGPRVSSGGRISQSQE